MKTAKNYLKLIISTSVLGFLFLVNSSAVQAYGVDVHEYLTSDAASLYNNQTENKITANDVAYLKSGARKEDDFPRFLSHFYDPVHNQGLSESSIDKWSRNIGFLFPNIKSKDWAEKDNLQRNLGSQVIALGSDSLTKFATVSSGLSNSEKQKLDDFDKTVDFTWRRAITLYNSGEREKAFYALGHVLHLIEDVSVPDHTRNDPHPDGSPYELFSDRYSLSNPDQNLMSAVHSIIRLNSLGDYFDSLARYSNNNFYSLDTTSGAIYENPKKAKSIEENGFLYDLADDGSGRLHKIIASKIYSWSIENNPVTEQIWSEGLLSDYWSHLAPQAIEHAAGVIDLFFKEAEKAKTDPNFVPDNDKLYDFGTRAKSAFVNTASVVSSFLGLKNQENVIGTVPGTENATETKLEPDQKIFPSINLSKKTVYQPIPVLITGNSFTHQSKNSLIISSEDIKVEYIVHSDINGNISFLLPTTALPPDKYLISAKDGSGIISNEIALIVKAAKVVVQNKDIAVPSSISKNQIDEKVAIDNKNNEVETAKIVNQKEAKTACRASEEKMGGARDVVFNEIAWMGRIGDPLAEWMELKNVSDHDVDISEWTLHDKNRQINIIFPENSKMKSGALYLLERDNDGAVPEAVADLIYKGSLGNTNENLRLLNGNCEIADEIISAPRWPAGESTFKHTAERDKYLAWRDSLVVGGTPKKENSVIGYQYYSNGGSSSSNSSSNNSNNDPPVTLCKIEGADKSTKEILLSEISWSGESGHTTREWVELYNPNNSEVNLSGWQFQNKDGKIAVAFKAGDIIKSKDFYLLERGSADFISGITADKFFTGSINNSDEAVYLFDNECKIVDEVEDSGDSWKNIAGTASPDYRSAERQSDKSWKTYTGDKQNGVMGTPKAQNSRELSKSSNTADHIVISEIANGYGASPDQGFIEFYNPTDQEISLSGYALKIKDLDSTETIFAKNGSYLSDKSVKPKSFLLAAGPAHDRFFSKTSDAEFVSVKTFSDNRELELYDASDALIDLVSLKTIPQGSSLERKAVSGTECASPIDGGEFLGNGCMESSAFEIRPVPNPQNSLSLSEPRDRPSLNFSENDISLRFDFDKLAIVSSWEKDIGFVRIYDSGKILVSQKDSREIVDRIFEVGKTFSLDFKTFDEDGLESDNRITKTISIPRFNDLAFFRSNFRDLNNYSVTGPVVSIGFDKFPFVPANLVLNSPPLPNHKGLILYLNGDARTDEFLSGFSPNPEASNVINVCYNGHSVRFGCHQVLWLPDDMNFDVWIDGGANSESLRLDPYLKDGDKRIVLPLSGEFSPTDYFTVAYYGFYAGNDGDRRFKLLAVDNTKNYFSNSISHNDPPTTPQNISLSYFPADNSLDIKFDRSTDSDGPDGLISYELSFDGVNWKLTAPNDRIDLPFGDDFSIRFRAVDDLGVFSDISTVQFKKP